MNLPQIVKDKLISLGAGLEDSFLVAVSGGADSSALLLAMRECLGDRGRIAGAHLDHGVRAGSEQDLKRVVKLCRDLGVEVVTDRLHRADLEERRRTYGSLEAGMRELRYGFLDRAAAQTGSHWIVTGHTADDQAETVLFRLLRGMDWRSLAGIPERRGNLLRPLLEVSRTQTRNYCADFHVSPVADPTNYEETYARGRIRNRLLPGLSAHFDLKVSHYLTRMGHAAQRLSAFESRILVEKIHILGIEDRSTFSRDLIKALPRVLGERAVVEFLSGFMGEYPSGRLAGDVMNFILAGVNGQVSLPGNMILQMSYGQVNITSGSRHGELRLPSKELELKIPGLLAIPEAGIVITAEERTFQSQGGYPRGHMVLLARKSVKGSLWVRKRHPGDRFMPLGMKKHRKLKDLLVDRKIPRPDRDLIPIVLNSRGEILWVGGVEVSQQAALGGVEGEEAILVRIEGLPEGVADFRLKDVGKPVNRM